MEASLKRKTVKQTANGAPRIIDAEHPVVQPHGLFALLDCPQQLRQQCLSRFRNCENMARVMKRRKDGRTRSFRYEHGIPRWSDAQIVWRRDSGVIFTTLLGFL